MKKPLGFAFRLKLEFSSRSESSPEFENLKGQFGLGWAIEGEFIPLLVKARGEYDLVGTAVVTQHPPSIALGFGVILDASGAIELGSTLTLQIEFTAEANGLLNQSPLSVLVTFDVEVDVSEGWLLSENFETEFQLAIPLA